MSSVASLIVARNAADTIRDAIASALVEPIDELLIVDDASSDSTIEIVRSFDDSRVRVLELAEHRTLGYARGIGLEAVESDFCFLLDADDVFLPGRIERLMAALDQEGVDFVADELELVDGVTETFIRRLSIPDFLDEPPGLIRLFERNYLPGIGQIGFRVEAMRAVGYDPAIHGTEDTDLLLRAILAGLRGVLVREVGYRMRHFSGSVSRDRDRQKRELANALRKHSLQKVGEFLISAGASSEVANWALHSLAVFQHDFVSAKRILNEIAISDRDWNAVLEPDGPCAFSESWRLAFSEGTLALLMDDSPKYAADRLEASLDFARAPEALNNLGVAQARLGFGEKAAASFEAALKLNPGYADVRENLERGDASMRITALPLRREPSRSEY